jgi:hypothetical protein
MTTLLTEVIGAILDNYGDVVEGGNAYRGSGTAYKGIPGTHSWHDWVKDNGTGLAVTTAAPSTTSIKLAGVPAANAATMIRTSAPPFFILTTIAAAGGVTGAARKIASHDGTSTFVTAAFPGNVANGDTVSILEGFKRCPDGIDLEGDGDTEAKDGFDRLFRLTMLPGERMAWTGNGSAMYRTTLNLDLRILRRSRQHQCAESALQNVQRVAEALCRGEHRGSYTQSLLQAGPPVLLKDDINKAVVRLPLNLVYQLVTSFL